MALCLRGVRTQLPHGACWGCISVWLEIGAAWCGGRGGGAACGLCFQWWVEVGEGMVGLSGWEVSWLRSGSGGGEMRGVSLVVL